MTDTRNLNVTDIDFDSVRSNLKEFLRSQDTLQDYDFDGSAISTIIDLLAYTTHYNAVNANIGLNETFLDTAQFRGSVVGRARTLGYTPRSASAPVAFLDITVTNAEEGQPLVIPRGHRFKTKVNNTTYEYITTDEFRTDDRKFSGVRAVQAQLKTAQYIFDSRSSEKYLIPDEDVDTSTIKVTIQDSQNSSTSRVFSFAKTITDIDSDARVFFLSENPDGLFEVSFGDGTIGAGLENGNIIKIEYGVTKKSESNGARIFSMTDSISGFSEVELTTAQSSRGGRERESIDSIKRNAPITFASQNRGVTPKDYEAVIRENFSNVSSIRVWGGEDNDPPVYGKVFISILPRETEVLTDNEKTDLLNNILIPKSVLAITPEIVDPDFLFINLRASFKFNPSVTNLTRSQLEGKVRRAIEEFNRTDVEQFNSVFRYSNLLNTIDQADNAILNSFAQIFLEKRFVAAVAVPRRYELDYSVPLFVDPSTDSVIRSSSTFTIGKTDNCFFEDNFSKSQNKRIISIVRGLGQNKRVIRRNAGFIEGSKIVLENFAPTEFDGLTLRVEVFPDVLDIASTFEDVVSINQIGVTGEVDPVVAGREFSGTDYISPSRNP